MGQQEAVSKMDKLNERFVLKQKKMMADGWFPRSPLWPIGHLNAIFEACEEVGVSTGTLRFDASYDGARKLHKWRMFRNYKFLLFLTKVWTFQHNLFKLYHIIDGHKFWNRISGDKMADIIMNYRTLSVYEPETTALFKSIVKPGMTCVDIGASIGYFTCLFSRAVGPTGKVIAIEPTDFQQPYLKRNIAANGYQDRVKQFAVGAWDKDEIVKMPRNAPPHVQTELRCRPIDDLLEEQGITSVDFIKIDTDGAEPWVLRGLLRTIERSPNMKMILEYYPQYVKDAGGNMKDIDDILEKYFTIYVIPDDYSNGCWNYLCTRK